MKREIPPDSDPLMQLLEEWQPQPELSPSFEQRLERRIQDAAAGPGARWRRWRAEVSPQLRWASAAVTMALLLTLGVFVYRGSNAEPPAPAAYQTAQVDPVMRDLQTLTNDGDLLEHLDFLSVPMSSTSKIQDRD
ncbi:MAG TPA: hypothetical protein VNF74_06670 [Terriglobales bacterium]|nr:hypothetical protein [Terriglobales bacterium]